MSRSYDDDSDDELMNGTPFEDETFFIEFIPDSRYVSTRKMCEAQYTDSHNAYIRTAGSQDIRMMHEYVPDHILEEDISKDSNATGAYGTKTSGRQRLDDLLMSVEIINERKFRLSERQSSIILDTYIVACLQKIFGDELIPNIDYILKKFNINELFEDVFVMMQRRGGKTIVTSVFIICFAATQLSGNINVYGKSKRVTKMMKDLGRELFLILADSKKFGQISIEEDNDERLGIVTKYKTLNRLNFFPCNSEVRINHLFFFHVLSLSFSSFSPLRCGE